VRAKNDWKDTAMRSYVSQQVAQEEKAKKSRRAKERSFGQQQHQQHPKRRVSLLICFLR
jgi:hypothetical protein